MALDKITRRLLTEAWRDGEAMIELPAEPESDLTLVTRAEFNLLCAAVEILLDERLERFKSWSPEQQREILEYGKHLLYSIKPEPT